MSNMATETEKQDTIPCEICGVPFPVEFFDCGTGEQWQYGLCSEHRIDIEALLAD
jgi:hypothetical protein